MNTSDILNKAADLIEQRGWAQASGWHLGADEPGPVCAEGALRLAVGGDAGRKNEVTGIMSRYLADLYPDTQMSTVHGGVLVFAWNDAPGRTPRQVIEALRACAVIESAHERETAAVS